MESHRKLPKIIFAEYHNDAKSRQVVNKLIPEFKKRGYSTFFEEMSPTETIESSINLTVKEITFLEDAYNDAQEAKDECKDVFPDDMEQYKAVLETVEPQLQSANLFLYQQYFLLQSMLEATQVDLTFCESIKFHNLEYIGIDNKDGRELEMKYMVANKQNHNPNLEEEAAFVRNQSMARAYLCTDKAVFGRIGVHHLKTIQHLIKEEVPDAEDNFLFLHIHSVTPEINFIRSVLCPFLSKHPRLTFDWDVEIKKFHEKVKDKEIIFPIGLHMFDADLIDEDKLVSNILVIIDQKIRKMNAYSYGMSGSPLLFQRPLLEDEKVPTENVTLRNTG